MCADTIAAPRPPSLPPSLLPSLPSSPGVLEEEEEEEEVETWRGALPLSRRPFKYSNSRWTLATKPGGRKGGREGGREGEEGMVSNGH